MTMRGTHVWTVGLLLLCSLGASSCGGSGGGPGPDGAGQGLVLVSFLERGVDNVPLNCRLTFEFSEPVDASTIGPDSIQVRQGDAFGMTAPGTFLVEGATVLFEPRLPGLCDLSDTGFHPDTDYRVQIVGWPEEACIRNTQGQPPPRPPYRPASQRSQSGAGRWC